MFFKLRYFLLLVIILLVIWQLYSNYSNYNNQTFRDDLNIDNILKTIKEHSNKSRVLVSVYYEALCPDSRSFFARHLLPAYTKLGNELDVDLIPYGKAKTTKVDEGKFLFDCQHGPPECIGNKLHACAILNIEHPFTRLKFVSCLISDFGDQVLVGVMCAEKLKVLWKSILNCAQGPQGDWLLNYYGERTEKLNAPLSFVPTVLLNENYHKQSAILKNLYKELCLNYQNVLSKCET